MTKQKALKEVVLFFAATLGSVYFIFWGPLALFKVPTISFVSDTRGPGWAIALFMIGGFTPSLVGLLLTWLQEGKEGLKRMGRRVIQFNLGLRWYLAEIGIVLLIGLGEIILDTLITGQAFNFSLFIQQAGSFLPLIIIGPLSEELGWRGYAQERMQKAWSPALSGAILGVAWAFWHLPLFFMIGTSQHELGLPFLPFIVMLSALSVIYAWFLNNTRGSIWSAILFHWLYTYIAQVISSGYAQTAQLNWLRCIPYLAAAGLVLVLWRSAPRVWVEEPQAG